MFAHDYNLAVLFLNYFCSSNEDNLKSVLATNAIDTLSILTYLQLSFEKHCNKRELTLSEHVKVS
jgi:hypothetical protein